MFLPAFVLLFIIRLRFPRNKPISTIIRNRYGDRTLQTFRKYERTTKQLNKLLLDREFLEACLHHEIIPKFLRLKLYRKSLEFSPVYKSWQLKMLKQEIRYKTKGYDSKMIILQQEELSLIHI